MRPVNMSFHSALLNSGCFSRDLAMPLAASTPRVFPSKLRHCRELHLSISSITGLAAKGRFWAQHEKILEHLPSSSELSFKDLPANDTVSEGVSMFGRAPTRDSKLKSTPLILKQFSVSEKHFYRMFRVVGNRTSNCN